MKPATIMAALLAASATPAFAQHQNHPAPPASPKSSPAPAGQDASTAAPTTSGPTGMSSDADVTADKAPMPGMEGMDPGSSDETAGDEPAPPVPTDHPADRVFDPVAMARARARLHMEHGGGVISKVMLNLGEYQVRDGENGYRWDGEAWVGGDLDRLVIKSEGEGGASAGVESAEIQALYSRAIGPYFDLQAGLRQDLQSGPRRTYVTIGFEGLAPYWFETGGALFLSDRGELLGRLEGTWDLRLTQRWILQPRIEANLSGQDIAELGLGSGVSSLETGLRLRYAIRPEFAPYVGLSFERKFGGTADYARALGKEGQATSLVIGVRAWF